MLEIALIAGIAAAVYGLWKTLFPSAGLDQRDEGKKEIALEALSALWARHRNTVISLEQLAGLWRSQAGLSTSPEAENLSLEHPELQDFYDKYVKGRTFAATPAGDVVKEILGLLDREGDCPSVANTKGEPDRLFDKTVYNVLAGVKLYRHSLNVAEEMIKAFKGSAAMLPKVLITSLGHDLGKLPSFMKAYYSTGDHPLISVTVLEGMKGYSKLPYKDEVDKAITDHHRIPKGLLGEKLKEADKDARRMEMAKNVQEHLEDAKPGPGPEYSPQPVTGTGPGGQKAESDNVFIGHAPEEKEKVRIKEATLPWFDADRFLAELKPYINRLDGPRWHAFSMPDGHVYFQAGVLEEVAKKLGRSNPDIALMHSDRELRRNILYSIVCNLRREKEAIARGLIKDGYFGGPFVVRMQDGKELSTYYTPFNAEAFGETVAYFEGLKKEKLKEIEDVRPKIQK